MGLADDVMQSIMTPGYTATGVVRVMYYAFYLLFATLAGMVIATRGNIHVIALLFLSIILFVTIRWFVAEMDALKKKEQQTKQN
ncbi:ER protein Pkr1-domain-containing protein [Syncephalastrum racemosum]|uniref:ER protein Pkr1-domain-containing protein n=1 Tax=Syncephalastrum racemosum TaxID=13706 RepID=A0A1X2H858_SYNRA|nr:ER protein Pkr1-domain-containing protein [Syncephalastrum racemosum]